MSKYSFLRISESDPSLLHVDHEEYKGNLRLRKPTIQRRLEHGQILGAWMNLLAGDEHNGLAEKYALVCAYIEEPKDNLTFSEIVDLDLLDALALEVQRYITSFRKAA